VHVQKTQHSLPSTLNCPPAAVRPKLDEGGSTLNSQLSTLNPQPSTLNSQPSALQSLNHFLKLRAEHINASIVLKVATECNVKPIALFAFDGEFVCLGDVGGIRRISPCLRDNLAVEMVHRESRRSHTPYMEPSYLIWTCWDWMAPVVGSLVGCMNTW